MELRFHFNCIYVIQSLPANEIQTGTHLANTTIKYRTYQSEHLTYQLIMFHRNKNWRKPSSR
ncbi:MAG: hypothetical protein H0X70_07240 [Segetibacter sp.]|nr:hypothetical protein [Segetibacter sp.]